MIETILPRYGVEVSIIDGGLLENWEKAIRPDTRLVFFETQANPTLEIVDIAGVSRIAHAAGATVVVDNAFATPALSEADRTEGGYRRGLFHNQAY